MVGNRSIAKFLMVTAVVSVAASALAKPAEASRRPAGRSRSVATAFASALNPMQIWFSLGLGALDTKEGASATPGGKEGASATPGGKPIVKPVPSTRPAVEKERSRNH